jgi:type II secretory ATPase GspE/PulE/Tfp pilus assembly ATPase PilB-like protein
MDPLVWLGAGLLTILTVLVFLSFFRGKKSPPVGVALSEPSVRLCPLCGSRLVPGQRVHSTVFATKTSDKLMEISGCNMCRPESPKALVRYCPVCKKPLRATEVVTARVFERQEGKKTHIHVLGCPRCREPSLQKKN